MSFSLPLHQSWPHPDDPKPIILIGAGGIVRDAHLPAYKKAGFSIAGVVDIDQNRAQEVAKDWAIPVVYPDLAAATSAGGTGVVYDIATPPQNIMDILPLLPDGVGVLIQKPMGPDQAEARRIRALCREKNLKAAVNFQLRFAPMMMAARDAIQRGLLGELLEIEVHLNVYTPWHLFAFLIPMKRVELSVHSIHYLDTIRAFAGNPRGVFARTMGDPRAKDFAQTRTTVILDYPQPLRSLMSINHNHQGDSTYHTARFRIEGTDGALMIKLGVMYDYPKGAPDELWFCKNGGAPEQIDLEGSWFVDAFMGTMRNVQRYVAGQDDHLNAGIEDAYQTMALVEACFTAAKAPSIPLTLDGLDGHPT
ncbi:MAG: Gfo/Idh/MocA family oxidoreductase [Pseudomonadota bacterium]